MHEGIVKYKNNKKIRKKDNNEQKKDQTVKLREK